MPSSGLHSSSLALATRVDAAEMSRGVLPPPPPYHSDDEDEDENDGGNVGVAGCDGSGASGSDDNSTTCCVGGGATVAIAHARLQRIPFSRVRAVLPFPSQVHAQQWHTAALALAGSMAAAQPPKRFALNANAAPFKPSS
jgi:hypothetical protein